MDFRPGPGQVALVEYPGAQEPMTGLVTNGHTEHIAIDLGAQAPSAVDRKAHAAAPFPWWPFCAA